MLTAVNQYLAPCPCGSDGTSPAPTADSAGCIRCAPTTNASVTRPSMAAPFSTRPKLPFQRNSQSATATGTAHQRRSTPVTNWSARQTPLISEASTRNDTSTTLTSGSRKKRMPNRSRIASGRVW
jgi:hypothetical protein